MASAKEMNPYKKYQRVLFNDKSHFLFKSKGKVTYTFDNSVHVLLDSGISIITGYKNLKNIKVKK